MIPSPTGGRHSGSEQVIGVIGHTGLLQQYQEFLFKISLPVMLL